MDTFWEQEMLYLIEKYYQIEWQPTENGLQKKVAPPSNNRRVNTYMRVWLDIEIFYILMDEMDKYNSNQQRIPCG